MKSRIMMVFLLSLLVIGWRQEPIGAETYEHGKIGFFSTQEIITKTESGKKSVQEIRKIYEEKTAKIKVIEKDLKTSKDYLDKNRSLLSPDVIKQLDSEYKKKHKDYLESAKKINEELKKIDQELTTSLLKSLIPQIRKIIRRLENEEGYTAIVDKERMMDIDGKMWNNLSYSNDKDITNRIIEEFKRLAIDCKKIIANASASATMSYAEARKVLTQAWEKSQGKWHNRYDNFRVSFIGKDKIELYARDRSDDDTFHDEKYCIDLVVMSYPYVEEAGFFDNYVGFRVRANKGVNFYGDFNRFEGMAIEWMSKPDAESFAKALTVLKQHAIRENERLACEVFSFADFQEQAGTWRTLTVKPGLTENVRRFRILAENAFDNKEFEKAADYYEQGLEIEPLWPEGQYNAAMIYGELKDYDNAALHMKRYLELVPNASDSQFARDQMIIWQSSIKQ